MSLAQKFLIESHLKETELYEKSAVQYVDKIVRVKEFVGAVDIGRFCIRLGANGWVRPVANRIGCLHRS